MEEVYSLVARISANTAGLTSGLQAAESAMSRTFSRISAMGRALTFSITIPLLGVGGMATSAFGAFETSLQQTVGLVGVAQNQVDQFKEEILATATELGKRPTEMADALYFITSAGLKGRDALDAMRYSAMASVSGLGEQKVVADLLTSAMNAYGPAVLSAKKATEILVATVREGKAEPPALAAALGQVLPIASAMGVTFDEVGATVAGMTRTGTSAETAAMQLKNILASVLNPSREAANGMAKVGLSARMLQNVIKQQGLLSFLQLLKERFGDNTEVTGEVFGNIRALTGILDLLGSNMSDNVAIFQRMQNTTGDLDRAFSAVQNTVKFKWLQLTASLQVGLIRIGEIMAPTFKDMLDRLQGAVVYWNSLSNATKKNVVIFGAIAAAVGPLLMLVGILGKIGMAFVAWTPFLLIVGGIAAGLTLAAQAAGGWGALWERAKGAVGGAIESIGGVLSSLLDQSNTLWEFIRIRAVAAAIVVAAAFMATWEVAKLVWSGISTLAQNAFAFLSAPAGAIDSITGSLLTLDGVIIGVMVTWAAFAMALRVTSAVLTFLGIKQLLIGAAMAVWTAILATGTAAVYAWNAATLLSSFIVGALYLGSLVAVTGAMLLYRGVMLSGVAVIAMLNVFKWSGVAAWMAYTATVTITTATIWTIIGVMTALGGVFLVLKVALAGAIGFFLMAKGAVWLFNAAMAAVNVTTLVTGAVLLAAFGGVVAVVYGVWGAVSGLMEVLGNLSGFSGPLSTISGVFGQWWQMVKDIATAFRVDMALGWDLLKVSAAIALDDVRRLFPPLWTAISDGFTAIWEYVGRSFKLNMALALRNFLDSIAAVPGLSQLVGIAEVFAGSAPTAEQIQSNILGEQETLLGQLNNVGNNLSLDIGQANEVVSKMQALIAQGMTVEAASSQLQASGFNQAQVEDAARRARLLQQRQSIVGNVRATQALNTVRDALGPGVVDILAGFGLSPELNRAFVQAEDAAGPAARQAGEGIGQQFSQGLKDTVAAGADAVFYGSLVALQRLRDYSEKLGFGTRVAMAIPAMPGVPQVAGGGLPAPAAPAPRAVDNGVAGMRDNRDVLEAIRDGIADIVINTRRTAESIENEEIAGVNL